MKKLWVPAILSDSLEVVAQQMAWITDNPSISRVHVDIVDSTFSSQISLPVEPWEIFGEYELAFDFHIMSKEPLKHIEKLIAFKNFPLNTVIFHTTDSDQDAEVVELLEKNDVKVGLALDVDIAPEDCTKLPWPELDMIQIMGVKPGLQGQKLIPRSLELLEVVAAVAKQKNWSGEIAFDGGVKVHLAKTMFTIGVDVLVVGSELWQSTDVAATKHALDILL